MATTHRPRHHQATNTGGIARCSIRPVLPKHRLTTDGRIKIFL